MSFIINIFENLIEYNNKDIFIIIDIHNNIWFKMIDIFNILDYNNPKKAIQKSNIHKNYKQKYKYIPIMKYPSRGTTSRFNGNTFFVNEAGLYQLLTNSNKSLANKFKEDIFVNILPTIRKTGKYKINKKENIKLKNINDKLQKKINKLQEENIYYENKYMYKPTTKSYIYIIKKNIGRKKCYKIGYTDDINKRLKIYKTGTTKIKIIYYISISFNGLQIEECIKNTNKLHKLKQKTDDLCFLSLKSLKISILECIKKIKNHICKCIYCKEKLKINKIDKHICKNKN